jgi:hypothetical protein
MSSCNNDSRQTSFVEDAASNYYKNNEDKFSFLVFDSKKIDSFLINYEGRTLGDIKLITAFDSLQTHSNISSKNDFTDKYSSHTDDPKELDFKLASQVLKATSKEKNHEYFSHSLLYLYFHECLPNSLEYKWVQDFRGDFEFNVTFFNLLRTKCKTYDNHIYGSEGYWDENIRSVFGDFVMNEITAEKAKQIKDCIEKSESFNDSRFETDKVNFLEFLNNVIAGKWRLFLYDKN